LEHVLAALRRVRARRRAARLAVGTALPILVLGAMLMVQSRRDAATSPATGSGTEARVAKTIEGTPIRVLSDEALLAVFKDRPVALIGEPGHQRLVLLDEVVQ
jgi:hypothetical protein